MLKAILKGWEIKWVQEAVSNECRRVVSHLIAVVVIGFGGGFRGENFFIASLKRMLKFWWKTR